MEEKLEILKKELAGLAKKINKMPLNKKCLLLMGDYQSIHSYLELFNVDLDDPKYDLNKDITKYMNSYIKSANNQCSEIQNNIISLDYLYNRLLTAYDKYSIRDISINQGNYNQDERYKYIEMFFKSLPSEVFNIYQRIVNKGQFAIQSKSKNEGVGGYCIENRNNDSSFIVVNKTDNSFSFNTTTVHEFGHAFQNHLLRNYSQISGRDLYCEFFSMLFEEMFIDFIIENRIYEEKCKINRYEKYLVLHAQTLTNELVLGLCKLGYPIVIDIGLDIPDESINELLDGYKINRNRVDLEDFNNTVNMIDDVFNEENADYSNFYDALYIEEGIIDDLEKSRPSKEEYKVFKEYLNKFKEEKDINKLLEILEEFLQDDNIVQCITFSPIVSLIGRLYEIKDQENINNFEVFDLIIDSILALASGYVCKINCKFEQDDDLLAYLDLFEECESLDDYLTLFEQQIDCIKYKFTNICYDLLNNFLNKYKRLFNFKDEKEYLSLIKDVLNNKTIDLEERKKLADLFNEIESESQAEIFFNELSMMYTKSICNEIVKKMYKDKIIDESKKDRYLNRIRKEIDPIEMFKGVMNSLICELIYMKPTNNINSYIYSKSGVCLVDTLSFYPQVYVIDKLLVDFFMKKIREDREQGFKEAVDFIQKVYYMDLKDVLENYVDIDYSIEQIEKCKNDINEITMSKVKNKKM